MRFVLLLAAVCALAPASSSARTWTVHLDGSGDFPTIQAALDTLSAAVEGDTVLVGPGRYTWTNQGTGDEHGMVRYWKSWADEVHLVSSHGPQATILDAEGQGRVFFANGDNIASDPVDFTVTGFTFTGGVAPKVPNRVEREGGAMAMHLCYVTVRDCVFQNNQASEGGAVWLGGVSAFRFEDCRFEDNLATSDDPWQISTAFPAPFGGAALVINSELLTQFVRCVFRGNEADYRGGAVFVYNANVEIEDCLFLENRTPYDPSGSGSAIYYFAANGAAVRRTTVRANSTYATGAAVLFRECGQLDIPIENSLIVANQGVAIRVEGGKAPIVTCTDIYGHGQGNWLVPIAALRDLYGNMEVDPLFCTEGDDARAVQSASPLLDAPGCASPPGGVHPCGTVPVLVSEARAFRSERGARVEWRSGVDRGWRVAREQASGAVTRIGSRPERSGERWWIEDDHADEATSAYRLEDAAGVLHARLEFPAAAHVGRASRWIDARPNPFNPRTRLSFVLDAASRVQVTAHDLRGRRVATLLDEDRSGGVHQLEWEARDDRGSPLASGVYLLRLRAGGREDVLRASLVR